MTIELGGEQVVLERVECVEILGRPFTITVDIIATLGEINLLPHLGKPVGVRILEDDSHVRDFHGLITDGEYLEESAHGFHYRLTARPFTYLMAQNRNFAIFQDKSALDIIKQVFTDAGASDIDYTKLSKTYPPRTYCVQYGESDFAFISRLMEDEGIYYFYEHTTDRHKLVLCDSPASHPQIDPASLIYKPTAAGVFMVDSQKRSGKTSSYIHKWSERVSTSAEAKVTLRDFDLAKPQRPVQAVSQDAGKHPNDNREVYAYPGGFIEEARGTALSKTMLEALRAERQLYFGESKESALYCGGKFTLKEHPAGRLNVAYLVTHAYHSVTAESYRSGHRDGEQMFNVRFEAIPASVPFRLPRSTPRPRVEGLETAIVSGPDGEKIFTDDYGRVKVRFHWDRGQNAGDKSTCWIRVAQFGNLGSVILPRVGQEVMVDFLSGDPDQPIVCGWVFNKTHMPTYDLPANKTRALWRTQRYGEAGDYPDTKDFDIEKTGVNELRFEDKGGKEEVYLHAERDMNVRVRFDQTNQVAHNLTEKVGHQRERYVGGEEKITVDKKQTITINDDQEETIQGDRKTKANSTDSLKVAQSQTIEAGTTIEVKANTSITFKVGQSSIVIDQMGVTIKGMMLSTEAQVQSTVKSLMTEVDGSAMTTIKGGLVMIN